MSVDLWVCGSAGSVRLGLCVPKATGVRHAADDQEKVATSKKNR